MSQAKLQVYEPPMCCSSGVCGPKVDPMLVRFSNDLDWLRKRGVVVERFNLSSHPAAFARQECVREALTREGNVCLPLILVDGVIVSRCSYPSRSRLMEFTGMDKSVHEERSQGASSSASALNSRGETAACGAGCACNAPSGRKGLKVAASLLVLVGVIGVLVYKSSGATLSAANGTAAGNTSTFGVVQTTPEAVPSGVEFGPPPPPPAASAAAPAPAVPPVVPKAVTKIGEYIETFNDLNRVALNQNAVVVFIPRDKDAAIQGQTNDAVLAAQKTLKGRNIALGLYTLATSSPDYAGVAKQVQTPAVLVATKGGRMAVVSGEVTESKLLQAYVTSSRVGSCGPGGCGPAGCQ